MPENAPLVACPLLILHPWSGLRSTFLVRPASLLDAARIAQALRARIERHELN